MNNKYLFFICLLLVLLSGCAGVRSNIIFDNLNYPLSFSKVLDSTNDYKNSKLILVKSFQLDKIFWGIFYSLISITDDYDISQDLNELIMKNNGIGIINLTIVSNSCELNFFWPYTVLPFWPGCTKVTFSGDIVRYE